MTHPASNPSSAMSQELSEEKLLQIRAAAEHYVGANGYDPDPLDIIALTDELLEAREALSKSMDEYFEPRLREMSFSDGQFDASVTGAAVNHMALAIVSNFKASGAKNYIEMNLHDREEPFQRYTVTVQKVGALSPADKVRNAEAALLSAQRKNEELVRAITEIKDFPIGDVYKNQIAANMAIFARQALRSISEEK